MHLTIISIFLTLASCDFIDRYGVSFTDSTLVKLIKTPNLLKEYSIPTETEIIAGGNGVNQQEKSAFYNCKDNIKKILFPKGSKLIKIEAYGCAFLSVLEEIDLSECQNLISLSNAAFKNCSKVKRIILPPNLESLSESALSGLASIERIDFPSSLKSIGSWTQYGNVMSYCSSLKTVTWGSEPTIERLGSGVFDTCNISIFEIPASLKSMITSSINGNPIENIIVHPDNRFFKSEGPILYNYDMTEIKFVSIKVTGEFITKTGVTTIGQTAFIGSKVSSIVIQPSITKILMDAFYSSSITQIKIPSTVTYLGDRIFGCCEYLEKVELYPTMNYLPSRTFDSCSSLKEVIIPSCMTNIGERCFQYCSSIEHIYIPNTVSTINSGAFYSMNRNAFIEFQTGSPLNVQNGILYSNDGMGIISYVGQNSEVDVVIRSDISYVDLSAFEGVKVRSIKFEAGVDLQLYQNSFKNTLVESITFPSSITAIQDSSFENCTNLKNIDFSASLKLTSISGLAFSGTSLTTVTFPSNLASLGDSSFAISTLKSVSFSGNIKTIGSKCFETSSILTFIVRPSISQIGSDAFKNSLLKTVIFEGSSSDVQWEITEAAFRGSKELETVDFGQRINSIGREAFSGCINLKSIHIADSITKICSYAFQSCEKLCNVSIGENSKLVDIQNLAFDQCFSLFSFQISESNPNFEANNQVLYKKGRNAIVLYLPASLDTSFVVPKSVNSIEAYAFQRAIHLEQIIFEKGDNKIIIGYGAFMECTGLKQIMLPSSIKEIYGMAFYGCDSLGCGSILYEDPNLLPYIEAASPPVGALIPCPTAAFTVVNSVSGSVSVLVSPLISSEDNE